MSLLPNDVLETGIVLQRTLCKVSIYVFYIQSIVETQYRCHCVSPEVTYER